MAMTAADKMDLANKIQAAEAQIPTITADINKARLAGLDVSDATSRLTALQNQVRLLKQHYGSP